MKLTIAIIGMIFLVVAALAAPAAIVYAIYTWAVANSTFAIALWAGAKVWMSMLGLGLVVGLPCHLVAHS